MSNVFFSIIVPIYNVSQFLRKCIESILEQTYCNYELILVDDGSSDTSGIICDQYSDKDSRIKVIHQKNAGLVSARQVGAGQATGDYIVCIDGDDYVDHDLLLCFEEAISNYSPDIVACGYYKAFPEQIIEVPSPYNGFFDKEKIIREIYPILFRNDLGKSISPIIWAKAFRRELYMKYQMIVPLSISIGEDAAVTKPCYYSADSVYFSNESHYYYRQNPKSLTKSKKVMSWELPRLIMQHYEKQIDFSLYDFANQRDRYIVHSLFNVAASQFYSQHTYVEISKSIIQNLSIPYYKDSILRAKFSIKAKEYWACLVLKHHNIMLLKLYSIFK